MKDNTPKAATDPEARIAELVRTLGDVERELQALAGGQVDAVTAEGRTPYLLRDAQEKLRQSEAAQRALAETQSGILNALPAHIALLDSHGVIVAVNEAWRRFATANVLQSSDFFVGQNYIGICERAHGECAEEAGAVAIGIRKVLSDELKEFSIEYPCHSPSEERWFRLMVTPLSDAPGSGAVVMHINVTERRLAEEILKEKEREQRRLAEELTVETRRLHESQSVANVGSWETDLATFKVTWTPETFRILETTPEQFKPTHAGFMELVHPDDRQKVDDAFTQSLGRPGPFSIEHRILLPGGRVKHVEERWQAFNDATGKPVRAVGTCQDITERKVAENLIRTRARQQETIAKIGYEATRAMTLEGIFDYATRAVAEAIEVDLCKVLQLAPDGSHLRMVSGVGWQAGLIGVERVGVERESQAGFTLISDGPIYVNDIAEETRFTASALLRQHDVVSGLSVNILLRDKPWGVLSAHCRMVRNFNDADADFMQAVATLLAVVIERLAVQRTLTKSEAQMRDAQRIAHLGNWQFDIAKNELSWSEEVFRIFGVEPANFSATYEGFFAFVHPDDREAMQAARQMVISGQAPLHIEHRIIRGDGAIRFVRERGELIHDENGIPVALSGTVLDITDLRAAQSRAERMNALLTEAQRIADMSSWEMDLSTDELVWSDETCRLFGIQPDELIGSIEAISEFVLPEDRAKFDADHTKVTAEKPYVELEYRIRRRGDGEVRWMFERRLANFDAVGRMVRRFGVVMDITEHKRAEEAVLNSMEEFRNLAEAMPQIVWVTGADGSATYLNQIWMDYTGLTLGESLGHGWNEPFHPEDQQRAWDAWRHAVSTVSTYSLECRMRRADGEYRWWLIRGEPQKDVAGNVLKWFGTCTDIHDLKFAELEITRTNRALKMLSACNEALIHAVDEIDLLKVVCEIALASGGYRMAWVGYAQEDSQRTVKPMAHAGDENGYLSEVAITWQENIPEGNGPAGRTIRSGKPCVCADIEQDDRFLWREPARKRGYRSLICLPLRAENRTFGVLALYSDETLQIGEEAIRLLQDLADDLAFGIGHLRAQRESERIHSVVAKVATAVSASTGTEFFEQLAGNMAGALGAAAGFLAEMLPGDPPRARVLAGVVDGKKVENFDYAIAGTPCEQLMEDDECVFPERVAGLFPESSYLAGLGAEAYVGRRLTNAAGHKIGLLYVIFREPLMETEFITATLRIFAARAASEMERRKSDEQVREQAALLDAAHDAIFVCDLEGRVVYWNKGAERLYGWTAAEMVGRQAISILYAEGVDVESAYQRLFKIGSWEGELPNLSKEGKSIPVQVSWTIIRDSNGRPTSVLAINSDLTEKKKLEAQFLRAQRMESIGTLAGGIAHDLNNVLAPIMMSVELLKDAVVDEEDQRLLSTLMSSAQRGANLVAQVLAFARGVEGQRIPVNVGHLVGELVRVMRETFPKNISIESKSGTTIWPVPGDPTQIHQVVLNLCVNARDAMPNGGKLSITVENIVLDDTFASMNGDAHAGSHVVIKVEDSGTGIAHDVMERIFEPFFTTKELGKGTGLGLSTTLAIVKSHGGFINLYSEIGRGTKFRVYFPADALAEPSAESSIEQARLPRGNGELILVVDDEESIRNVARSTLQRFGYSVLLAQHGAEAIAIYAQQKGSIAVVLTDMAMPIMDGPSLIRALKSIDPKVRIIGSSGLTSNAGDSKGAGLGLEYFIPKPYTAEAMLRAIRSILDTE